MTKFKSLLLIFNLLVIHVEAQHHAEWKLLETIKPTKPYAQLDSFTQWYYPKPLYEEALTQKDFICFRFSYPSDGLTIFPRVRCYHLTPLSVSLLYNPVIQTIQLLSHA